MSRLTRLFARFKASRRGNVAVIAALALPAFIGFCGLAGETSYWYFRQRDMQGAADVAAYNGTIELRSGGSNSEITHEATSAAETSGWKSSLGTITVNTPPTSGSYQSSGKAVEVILTEDEPRYFTALFANGTVPIKTRAVAVYSPLGNACLLALDKSASGAIQFWGNTGSTFTACNVYSDSISQTAFMVGGAATVSVPCALAVGGFDVDSGLSLTQCTSPTSSAAYLDDPYKDLPPPPIPNSCTNGNTSALVPGKYCNGLTINGTVTMAPGIYVISGGTFKLNATAILTGSDVMIYLTNNATIQMNGQAHANLSAATTGTYAGVLLYGDRNNVMDIEKINGDASSSMTGAIYFPSTEVQLLGNFSGDNGCMQVVADMIYYSGDSTFSSDCSAYGLNTISTPGEVTLVE